MLNRTRDGGDNTNSTPKGEENRENKPLFIRYERRMRYKFKQTFKSGGRVTATFEGLFNNIRG